MRSLVTRSQSADGARASGGAAPTASGRGAAPTASGQANRRSASIEGGEQQGVKRKLSARCRRTLTQFPQPDARRSAGCERVLGLVAKLSENSHVVPPPTRKSYFNHDREHQVRMEYTLLHGVGVWPVAMYLLGAGLVVWFLLVPRGCVRVFVCLTP